MRERERVGNRWMIWLLMWLNMSVVIINVTFYLYINLLACIISI